MSSRTMMLLFGAGAVLGLPLIGMFFLLFVFGPASIAGGAGSGGAAAICNGPPGGGPPPPVTDTEDQDTGGSDIGKFRLPKPDGPGEQTKGAAPIPATYLAAYKAAGERYGLPWELLAGIGNDESGHHAGSVSSAGAQGPMQFMPDTWTAYGVDGNHDGVKNAWDIGDAAFGAANLLVANGAKRGPQGVWSALWAYNHLHAYANDVLRYAWTYATGKVPIVSGGDSGECSTVTVTAGTVNGKILQYAQKWIGTPYQFGGGDEHGPTVGQDSRGDGKLGFDCSGLVLYAVYNATGGHVDLPHNAALQYEDRRIQHLTMDQLQPGDLVFLDDLGHIGIYAGNQKILDAPKTFEYVRYDSIAPGSYFYGNFVGGGRVIYGNNDKS